MVYGVSSLFYLASDELNLQENIDQRQTFILKNELDKLTNDMWRLAVICYYALSTMSTVGYGDLVPITELEMIFTMFIQLLGVGIFAAFLEVLSEKTTESKNHK